MRLLHTSTFEVKSFFDQNLPPYAILSHTWGNEEVTLRELQQETTARSLRSLKTRIVREETFESIESTKKGFVKLVGCALQAERNGFSYIWCDTCCIDKTNSTELSEAINSMFYWYKNQLCYAYLDDVPHSPGGVSLEEDSAFARSRWFTRGWTLQELIAPRSVIFFDARWHPMGSRSQFSDFISDKTGIDRSVLNGQDPALSSIAKRMSWASRRQTTRIEDMAYSLIGLFGVNMPLLYGEREKAFLRLQEEIMKAIEDHSLFAWKTPALGFLETGSLLYSGLLATSPADFAESRNILPFQQEMGDGMDVSQPPYSMTNKGISISLPILPLAQTYNRNGISYPMFFATLDCHDSTDTRGPLGIYLGGHQGYYHRCHTYRLIPAGTLNKEALGGVQTRNIYVEQRRTTISTKSSALYHFYIPEIPQGLQQHNIVTKMFVNSQIASWDPESSVLFCSRGLGCAVFVGNHEGRGRVLLIGIDPGLRARCVFDHANETIKVIYKSKKGDELRPVWSFFDNELKLAPALLAYRFGYTGLDDFNTGPEEHLSWFYNKYFKNTASLTRAELERNRTRWDSLEYSGDGMSTSLALGNAHGKESRTSKFYNSKRKELQDRADLSIKVVIGEELVNGRMMFSVRFNVGEKQDEEQERVAEAA